MKKLLFTLLSLTSTVLVTSMTVVACGSSPNSGNDQTDLSTVDNLQGMTPLLVDNKKTYSAIDNTNFSTATVFTNKPFSADFTVDYYQDSSGTTPINSQMQAATTVYVKISANANDKNWTGSTKLLAVTIAKNNLQQVNNLDGMDAIVMDVTKPFSAINLSWFNADWMADRPVALGFTINYFSDAAGKNNINGQLQNSNAVFVQITAAVNDPYWTGTTQLIGFRLSADKIDLNTISDLSGMNPIFVNVNSTFAQIDKNIINTARQFQGDPLMGNFTIHYFSDYFGTISIDQHKQYSGKFYVMIDPDANQQTHWKATVFPIAIELSYKA